MSKGMILRDIDKEELLAEMEIRFDRILTNYDVSKQPKYVNPKTAMETLGVRISKLQQLRNNDEIKYAKTSNRGIMYDYQSLIDYLDRKVVE